MLQHEFNEKIPEDFKSPYDSLKIDTSKKFRQPLRPTNKSPSILKKESTFNKCDKIDDSYSGSEE